MTRNQGIALVLAVILVAVGVAYFALNNHYSSRQNYAIGNGLAVSGNKVPNNIHASVVRNVAPVFPHTQALGSTVQVTPAGSLPAPMTLSFKLNRRVAPSDVILMATAEQKQGPWTLAPTQVTDNGWYADVQTDHLSWWTPLWFDIQQAVTDFKTGIVDTATSDLTAQADRPHCDNEGQARQDNYSISSSAKDTLYWCFGFENGERVLKIVNRMRYPLEVGYPGFTVTHQELPRVELDQLTRLVTNKTIILYPFEEAEFAVNLPDKGGQAAIKTTYSGLAQSLYQLQFAVTTLLKILDRFGFGTGVRIGGQLVKSQWDEIAQKTDEWLRVPECFNALLDLEHPGSMLSRCFTAKNIIDAFGWKGRLLAPVMLLSSIGEFFLSEFDVIRDQFTGASNYEILLTHLDKVTITITSTTCEGCIITAVNAPGNASDEQVAIATVTHGQAVMVVPWTTTHGMAFAVQTPQLHGPNAVPIIALGYDGVAPGTSLTADQIAQQQAGSWCWAGATTPDVTFELRTYLFPDPVIASHFDGMFGSDSIGIWAAPTLPTMGEMMGTYHGGLDTQNVPFCPS